MYCKNCGNEMNENAAVCLNCGAAKNAGKGYCANCGNAVNENASVCLNCGAAISSGKSGNGQTGDKQKTVAGLLAIFLGWLGLHWFYLGFNKKGLINICIWLVSLVVCFMLFIGWIGILGILALVIYNIYTAVQIFMGKQPDANGYELK